FLVLLQALHGLWWQPELEARPAHEDHDESDDDVRAGPDGGGLPLPGHEHHDENRDRDQDREPREQASERDHAKGDGVGGRQLLGLLLGERDLERDKSLRVAYHRCDEPARAHVGFGCCFLLDLGFHWCLIWFNAPRIWRTRERCPLR